MAFGDVVVTQDWSRLVLVCLINLQLAKEACYSDVGEVQPMVMSTVSGAGHPETLGSMSSLAFIFVYDRLQLLSRR